MRPAAAAAIVKWELILSTPVLASLSRTGTSSALVIASTRFTSSWESVAPKRETCEEVMQDEARSGEISSRFFMLQIARNQLIVGIERLDDHKSILM